jgi:hypothetical protein
MTPSETEAALIVISHMILLATPVAGIVLLVWIGLGL